MSTQAIPTFQKPRKPPLRLSPLLRFSLSTAVPDPEGKPILLPLKIPKSCCHDAFRCKNLLKWSVSDGINAVNLCRIHFESFWESGKNVLDYRIERI